MNPDIHEGSVDDWGAYDALRPQAKTPGSEPIGPVAFYWRVSTEDKQSPDDSRLRQLARAEALITPLGGKIVAEFSDIGVSRSMAWVARPGAAHLLGLLRTPEKREWKHVVIGEGDRAFYGDQFSQTWPQFEAAKVDLFIPEIGGRYDPTEPLSKTMMSLQGAMSEAEIASVRRRVRETMAAIVVMEGRHMGGRAPYGYQTINSDEPHPNRKLAAEGRFKRILVIDPEAAVVVQRIFDEYIKGAGFRAIAHGLNRDGVPCPSARQPTQNKHRPADGWQQSTIDAILQNLRYTGYMAWGAFENARPLLNIQNPSLGYELKHRRADPSKQVRSRGRGHEPIIDVATFTRAAQKRASKSTRPAASERAGGSGTYTAVFRSIIRCSICGRKMHPTKQKSGLVVYQCRARDLAPGSQVADLHPRTSNISENALRPGIDSELARLLSPQNRAGTIKTMVESQESAVGDELAKQRNRRDLADAKRDARNLVEAVAKSGGSDLILEALAKAEARIRDLETDADSFERQEDLLSIADVEELLEGFGVGAETVDLGQVLAEGAPSLVADVYVALGVEIAYDSNERKARVSVTPNKGESTASWAFDLEIG